MDKVIKFSDFNKKINESASDFITNLENSSEVENLAETVLSRTVEKLSGASFEDSDDFSEKFEDNIVVYDTDVADFDLSEQIDICIWAEDAGYLEGVPDGTKFDYLGGVIYKQCEIALNYLIKDKIIGTGIVAEIVDFVEENDLSFNTLSFTDKYGHAAPKKIRSVENGEVQEFRNLDGSFNIDQYVYTNDTYKVEIYFTKMV